MDTYIAALDQGTTSSRAILFHETGEIAARAQYPFRQIYPQPGWVEHDPMEIWASERRALAEITSHIDPRQVAAIGITNQRETTILWDRRTGEPIHNAIVWQCRRTAPFCDELKARGLGEIIAEKTGLLIDAYFSASKIRWLLDHVPGARERAELVYHQANGVLNEAIAKVDTATAEITAKTDEAMSQLTQLQMAVSTSKQALQDAASLMNTIRPNY